MAKTQQLKKLEPCKTVIGKVVINQKGKYIEFDLLYGNGVLYNDTMQHIATETYQEKLQEFLDSEEGALYEFPSDEDIEQAAIACANEEQRLLELKKKREAEEKARQEREAKALAERKEKERIEQEKLAKERAETEEKRRIEEETRQRIEAEMRTKIEQEQAEKQRQYEEIQKIQETQKDIIHQDDEKKHKKGIFIPEEDDEKYEEVEEVHEVVGTSKPLLIVCVITMLLTLVGNALIAYTILFKNNDSASSEKAEKEDEKKTITLDIDGQQYQIEMDNSEIPDGDTQITVYGIASTNKDGKIKNSVIPMGTVQLEQEESENPKETKTSETAGDK